MYLFVLHQKFLFSAVGCKKSTIFWCSLNKTYPFLFCQSFTYLLKVSHTFWQSLEMCMFLFFKKTTKFLYDVNSILKTFYVHQREQIENKRNQCTTQDSFKLVNKKSIKSFKTKFGFWILLLDTFNWFVK